MRTAVSLDSHGSVSGSNNAWHVMVDGMAFQVKIPRTSKPVVLAAAGNPTFHKGHERLLLDVPQNCADRMRTLPVPVLDGKCETNLDRKLVVGNSQNRINNGKIPVKNQ